MTRRKINNKNFNNSPPPQPPPAQLNVDLRTLPDFACPNCDSIYFLPVVQIKTMSAIVSPDGKERRINVQHFACVGLFVGREFHGAAQVRDTRAR